MCCGGSVGFLWLSLSFFSSSSFLFSSCSGSCFSFVRFSFFFCVLPTVICDSQSFPSLLLFLFFVVSSHPHLPQFLSAIAKANCVFKKTSTWDTFHPTGIPFLKGES
eukprot:TRINITY_DN8666_c0_g1_i1.p2 TRINITY_DN8666_c0_g1~~TRINITY_DN8666_c0_g1_i1.p2  ORF type:complete len:107 (+),score=3.51 TRINITY_DN8666_c0_g1_i1:820-1140(+)